MYLMHKTNVTIITGPKIPQKKLCFGIWKKNEMASVIRGRPPKKSIFSTICKMLLHIPSPTITWQWYDIGWIITNIHIRLEILNCSTCHTYIIRVIKMDWIGSLKFQWMMSCQTWSLSEWWTWSGVLTLNNAYCYYCTGIHPTHIIKYAHWHIGNKAWDSC